MVKKKFLLVRLWVNRKVALYNQLEIKLELIYTAITAIKDFGEELILIQQGMTLFGFM